MKKLKVAVIGATGFTGEKLVELLLKHSQVEVTYLTSRTPQPVLYSKMFTKFKGKTSLYCQKFKLKDAILKADLFFLALPHTVSMDLAPKLIKEGKKVIDLSADYRIKDTKVYKKFYKTAHKDSKHLKQAVYGMPEFYKKEITKAKLIANPGCYPTSVILALAPLVKEKIISADVIVDAKSSITGAGRKAKLEYHYSHINNNIWAYKPFVHQHVPEMVQIIKTIAKKKVDISFVPQVVSVESGIYSTIYVDFLKKMTEKKLKDIYKKYYGENTPFVRIVSGLSKLSDVANTNFCDIGFAVSGNGKRAVVTSAIDNLIKGAAGTAVHNMNIMCGFKEKDGLL